MGNTALTRKVEDLSKSPVATAGHLGLWQIHSGKHKETEELVSLWTFDKNDFTKKDRNGGPIKDKDLIESIFKIMLKDLQFMKDCRIVQAH